MSGAAGGGAAGGGSPTTECDRCGQVRKCRQYLERVGYAGPAWCTGCSNSATNHRRGFNDGGGQSRDGCCEAGWRGRCPGGSGCTDGAAAPRPHGLACAACVHAHRHGVPQVDGTSAEGERLIAAWAATGQEKRAAAAAKRSSESDGSNTSRSPTPTLESAVHGLSVSAPSAAGGGLFGGVVGAPPPPPPMRVVHLGAAPSSSASNARRAPRRSALFVWRFRRRHRQGVRRGEPAAVAADLAADRGQEAAGQTKDLRGQLRH